MYQYSSHETFQDALVRLCLVFTLYQSFPHLNAGAKIVQDKRYAARWIVYLNDAPLNFLYSLNRLVAAQIHTDEMVAAQYDEMVAAQS